MGIIFCLCFVKSNFFFFLISQKLYPLPFWRVIVWILAISLSIHWNTISGNSGSKKRQKFQVSFFMQTQNVAHVFRVLNFIKSNLHLWQWLTSFSLLLGGLRINLKFDSYYICVHIGHTCIRHWKIINEVIHNDWNCLN